MIKLKVELQIGGETTKSKAPGPIIMIDKSKTGTVFRSYLLHSSGVSARLCCVFYQPQHSVRKRWAKTILLSQTGMFALFFIQY